MVNLNEVFKASRSAPTKQHHAYCFPPLRQSPNFGTRLSALIRSCMNKLLKYLTILLPCACIIAAGGSVADTSINGFAEVIDGDTLRINTKRIRLFGIDAPELRQLCLDGGKPYQCGVQSKTALERRIGGSRINCLEKDRDRYGRVVAICKISDLDLNSWMVREGMALAYRRYTSAYVGDERIARSKKLGLWANQFVKPWDWRRGSRLNQQKNLSPSAACNIKGNINRRGKKIYHLPSSKSYAATKIDLARGEKWFCTEQEALGAGWKKATK